MFKYKEFVTHNIEAIGGEPYDAYEFKQIETDHYFVEDAKLADHAFVLRVMGHLLGKVLTTIEATTSNDKQAKAIKDLMRGHFSSEMEFVGSMMFDQVKLNQAAEEAVANIPDDKIVGVEIEEVLGVGKRVG